MKIGIVGSRRRNLPADYWKVRNVLAQVYKLGDTIVSGGCPKGADHFADLLAKERDIPIKIYPADWSLGKHAGFLRNTDIAKDSDILIACVSEDRTGGTEDTITKFKKFHPEGRLILC